MAVAPASGELDLGDLYLAPGAVLLGRVVDENGGGIPFARIFRSWEEWSNYSDSFELGITRADESGRFRVDTLPPGPFWLAARATGYHDKRIYGHARRTGEPVARCWIHVADSDAESDEGWRWMEDELQVQLASGPTVTGRVEGLEPGQAAWIWSGVGDVDDARRMYDDEGVDWGLVWRGFFGASRFYSAFTPVAADGTFAIGALKMPVEDPSKNYPIRLVPVARWYPYVQPLGQALELARADEYAPQVLEVVPPSPVRVRVIDRTSGATVDSALVRAGPIQWKPREMTSIGNGVFEANLRTFGEAPRARVWVTASGFQPYLRDDFEVRPGVAADLGVIELEPAPTLRVNVIDADTGEGIEGAWVSTCPGQTGERTAFRDGWMNLTDPGDQAVSTNSTGSASVSRSLVDETSIHAGAVDYETARTRDGGPEIEEVTIRLRPAEPYADVELRVLDQNGTPFAGAVFEDYTWVTWADEQGRVGYHLSEGRYSFALCAQRVIRSDTV